LTTTPIPPTSAQAIADELGFGDELDDVVGG